MTQSYLLEWLDTMVTLNLNPGKNNFKELTPQQSGIIITKAIEETQLIRSKMTIQVFSLTKEKQIKVLIGNYHCSLINLWDNLMLIENSADSGHSSYKKVISTLFSCLDELLNFIESRFANFLSLDARMPALYAASLKRKIKKRTNLLAGKSLFNSYKTAAEIVLGELYRFANSARNEKITFREILYRKQLLKKLENLKPKPGESSIFSDLNEVLIHMNFNSPLFINFFTKLISDRLNESSTLSEKRENLLLYFKELNQIYTSSDIALYRKYPDLKKLLHQWFEQEIIFLEKKQQLSAELPVELPKNEKTLLTKPSENTADKVTCLLSTDQTALILRASQELNILVSKSMNHLFKIIVPFLSTGTKSSLSYDSMRSKAYSIEERDKEIAIDALEQIIKKIKDY